ncbi:hypothetical protein DRN74_03395 [Candidatus Micrarchaeota archaeon]|nr:MAG: hypothetical protein DRN74_03395 [Candidatus Micrarchaeota archaeon]
MEDKMLFELSYEVCNKIGGIYRVIESKTPEIIKRFGRSYYAIGPYVPNKAAIWFRELPFPDKSKWVYDEMKEKGIIIHYGKWLVKGNPNAFLVDYSRFMKQKDKIKAKLWEDYKIDSLTADIWFDDPIVWATASGMLLEKLISVFDSKKMIAHFHEWLSGAALLYLKKKELGISTVFTTHATVMGRILAESGEDLYKEVNEGLMRNESMPDEKAKKYNAQAKHLTEKACAHNADVFTTVSEITAREAKYILGKSPDVITPNGLEISTFPSVEELINKHREYREKIRDFLRGYFNPYYPIDVEKGLIFFISGRYEFRNKGIDVFIDALGKLNQKLREMDAEKNVFAFLFIPAAVKSMDIEVLSNLSFFEDMKEMVVEELPYIKRRILDALVKGKMPKTDNLFDVTFLRSIKQDYRAFRKEGKAPLSTHILENEKNDPILNACRKNGLDNGPEDKVKVVFYPIYVSKADGMLGMDYNEVIIGSHLGVFPSYYEPWGYTPLETAAQNALAVTTDLAGFGAFVKKISDQSKKPGIIVLKRDKKTYNEVVNELYETMLWFYFLERDERLQKKAEARQLAEKCDWSILIKNYLDAYQMAVEKKK